VDSTKAIAGIESAYAAMSSNPELLLVFFVVAVCLIALVETVAILIGRSRK
jgi:hypothetical protein